MNSRYNLNKSHPILLDELDHQPYDIERLHFHNAFEIILIDKADSMLVANDDHFHLHEYMLVFVAPNVPHFISCVNKYEYHRTVLKFDQELVQDLLSAYGNSDGLNIIIRNNAMTFDLELQAFGKVKRLFSELTARYQTYKEDGNFSSNGFILALALFLVDLQRLVNFKRAVTSHLRNERVEEIKKFIDQNYMNDVSLDILSSTFFISKSYISRIFKKFTGVSIIDYLQIKRIIEAQKMLSDVNMSITDICYKCGFNNIQHFYRCFRKVTGVIPSVWKKKTKKDG